MTLPLSPPYPPMEALLVDEIPGGGGWQYEPKWDGFRCLAFRDGPRVDLQSKAGQPLERYFPELTAAFLEFGARRFVLDSEIVIPLGRDLSFDDLLQRIHPAASRIQKLSREHPATLIAFDLLVDERGKSLLSLPLEERRRRLEAFAASRFPEGGRIRLSPATTDLRKAKGWFQTVGGGLDGVMAKRLDLEYRSGDRTGMQKVKRLRTADCVMGGFRYASNARVVGSLLLGLYDEKGLLNHVGFTSGFPAAERKRLLEKVKPLIKPPGFTGRPREGRAAGAPSAPENGSPWPHSSSPRCATTTSPAAASATARGSSGGAPTRPPSSAPWPRWSRRAGAGPCGYSDLSKESRQSLSGRQSRRPNPREPC